MVFAPLTPGCRGIETPLLEHQVVTSRKVSGTFFHGTLFQAKKRSVAEILEARGSA